MRSQFVKSQKHRSMASASGATAQGATLDGLSAVKKVGLPKSDKRNVLEVSDTSAPLTAVLAGAGLVQDS
jgi:hypothetical protein